MYQRNVNTLYPFTCSHNCESNHNSFVALKAATPLDLKVITGRHKRTFRQNYKFTPAHCCQAAPVNLKKRSDTADSIWQTEWEPEITLPIRNASTTQCLQTNIKKGLNSKVKCYQKPSRSHSCSGLNWLSLLWGWRPLWILIHASFSVHC